MRKQLISILDWLILNLYTKPIVIYRYLLKNPQKIYHSSYYPELPSKSRRQIWMDQFLQCLKYGYPNEFYYPYGFDVKDKKQIEEYLHYAPFMKIRDAKNSSDHSATAILRDKLYFDFFTQALGINAGNNVGLIELPYVFDVNNRKQVEVEEFFSSLEGKFVFKPIDGECGSGIFVLKVTNGCLYKDDKIMDSEDLRRFIGSHRYLVQEIVTQHSLMASLHPQSLNTIRLVTIRNIHNGEITVFPSILRIGTGNSFVDNTSQGGLAVAVNLQTGRLGEFGFYKPEFGTKVSVHPDSGIRFSDFTIPFFQEAKEQAIQLHKMLPSVNSIGWDIAIGENGPIFIEGNDNWEINGPQICNGGLKKNFVQNLN